MGEPDERLAKIIGELAEQPTAEELMQYIVTATRDHIPSAEHAGLTLLRGGRLTTAAATGAVIRQIEDIEYRTGQGPCVSAALEEPFVHTPDLAQDSRWPLFSAEVLRFGFHSMLAFRFAADERIIGALNVYAASAGAFDEHADAFGTVFAPLGAVVLSLVSRTENLRIAVESRDVIGQAKGILMERYKLSADQAFQLLTTASQASNTKLRDVAEELAATGQIPGLE